MRRQASQYLQTCPLSRQEDHNRAQNLAIELMINKNSPSMMPLAKEYGTDWKKPSGGGTYELEENTKITRLRSGTANKIAT